MNLGPFFCEVTLCFSPSTLQKNNPKGASVESKSNQAKTFLCEMKKSLSQVTFDQIIMALQSYKATDSLDVLLSKTSVLAEDANTHGLLRGTSSCLWLHRDKPVMVTVDGTRRTWPEDKHFVFLGGLGWSRGPQSKGKGPKQRQSSGCLLDMRAASRH